MRRNQRMEEIKKKRFEKGMFEKKILNKRKQK
jgi:hypothetical protein